MRALSCVLSRALVLVLTVGFCRALGFGFGLVGAKIFKQRPPYKIKKSRREIGGIANGTKDIADMGRLVWYSFIDGW